MKTKLIAVVGATGAQGGGLVRAIAADESGEFRARAITRKPDGEQARALARLGVEVVGADLDDPASLERAFRGAYGAFCVTNFWEHFSPDKEIAQARNMAAAARATGVQYVIWSTLEDTRKRVPLTDERMPTLQGRFKVPHFDGKGEANACFEELPATLLFTSFHWDNLIHFGMGPKREADGSVSFVLPMGGAKLAGIAAADIGKCALGIFQREHGFVRKSVGIAGEHLSGAQMASELTRALGVPVAHRALSHAAYRALGFPGADNLGNMFQYCQEFEREFGAVRNVPIARALNPELQTFADFLRAHASQIAIG
jgi:uncharacterized protein YbjT (DUF2867 family)